ncbi:MAG: hypothetical protein KatS3mg002_0885 [Candidatus Woesearchaeota archaeon]|nr:MAG: hypothetical protein KatS3mg002_0885 [Candidatus Woesearchaeota archaeon]
MVGFFSKIKKSMKKDSYDDEEMTDSEEYVELDTSNVADSGQKSNCKALRS